MIVNKSDIEQLAVSLDNSLTEIPITGINGTTAKLSFLLYTVNKLEWHLNKLNKEILKLTKNKKADLSPKNLHIYNMIVDYPGPLSRIKLIDIILTAKISPTLSAASKAATRHTSTLIAKGLIKATYNDGKVYYSCI